MSAILYTPARKRNESERSNVTLASSPAERVQTSVESPRYLCRTRHSPSSDSTSTTATARAGVNTTDSEVQHEVRISSIGNDWGLGGSSTGIAKLLYFEEAA
jgi:hypothetical protein